MRNGYKAKLSKLRRTKAVGKSPSPTSHVEYMTFQAGGEASEWQVFPSWRIGYGEIIDIQSWNISSNRQKQAI